jgi:hypothetical protein
VRIPIAPIICMESSLLCKMFHIFMIDWQIGSNETATRRQATVSCLLVKSRDFGKLQNEFPGRQQR